MKAKGTKFVPGKVTEWLDCGNKDATVYTNQRILEFDKGKSSLRSTSAKIENSKIIEPCFIGENVVITNSTVGPHASIGAGTRVENSTIVNSIIQQHAKISSSEIKNSMIGNYAEINAVSGDYSLGDFSVVKKA